MPKKGLPSYRLHKRSGQAVVTLNGKDHYLGKHKSKASYEEYDSIIAEYLANGKKLPPTRIAVKWKLFFQSLPLPDPRFSTGFTASRLIT